jgi:hypothetical protein
VKDVAESAKHCSTYYTTGLAPGRRQLITKERTLALSRSYEQLREEANVIRFILWSKVHLTINGLSGRTEVVEPKSEKAIVRKVERWRKVRNKWPSQRLLPPRQTTGF